MAAAVNRIRQNYNSECEGELNKYVNMELYASYVYMSMAHHFNRDDISSKGFFNFYNEKSDRKREEAEEMMKYQNIRGGKIKFHDIKAAKVTWDSHLQTVQESLALEKDLNQSLLIMYQIADKNNDPNFMDFLDKYTDHQTKTISHLSRLITNLKRCGNGLGVYEFDKLTMERQMKL